MKMKDFLITNGKMTGKTLVSGDHVVAIRRHAAGITVHLSNGGELNLLYKDAQEDITAVFDALPTNTKLIRNNVTTE